MEVIYVCRYCKHLVGELNQPQWTVADAVRHLGIDRLTKVEQDTSVAYNYNRDVMYVETVCNHCQAAVESHPELLIEGKLLQ